MEFKISTVTDMSGIKITAEADGRAVGWAYLYVLKNSEHKEPFGLMENVYVQEAYRQHGIGSKLVEAIIREARARGCYKLIGTSRHTNQKAGDFYKKFGFTDWGKEFRLNFK